MSRKPLNLAEKWLALKQAATCDGQRLNATTLLVLFRLLDHQNPKTGRCNPSATRLARDIGVCVRTIYYAIDCLEKAASSARSRGTETATITSSSAHLKQNQQCNPMSGICNDLQETAAVFCTQKRKEKIKEKRKRNGGRRSVREKPA